jgi:hypothetical protein
MSILPQNNGIKQFCSAAVFNTRSGGQAVYSSCVHLGSTCGVINVKNCLLSATAKYENASSIIRNLLNTIMEEWEGMDLIQLKLSLDTTHIIARYNSNYRSTKLKLSLDTTQIIA